LIERVGVEGGLNHDERIAHVFVIQHVPIEGRLVRRVVENLQKLASTQVEHELGIECEVLLQSERRRVILSIVGKSRAEADEHPVYPSQHVWAVIDFGFEDRYPGHEDCSCLLIEGLRDRWVAGWTAEISGHRRHAQVELTRRVLVVRQELHHTFLRGLLVGHGPLAGDLEIDAIAGLRINTAHLPRARIPDAAFRFTNRDRFFVERHRVPDEPGDLELLSSEYFEHGVEPHEKIVVTVLLKHSNEGLSEHGSCEAVGQDHVSACRVAEALHLQEANLVQAASEYVYDVAIMSCTLRQVVIKLHPRSVSLKLMSMAARVEGLLSTPSCNISHYLGRCRDGNEWAL